MKPVIQVLQDKCPNCLKCLKVCPSDAISIVHHQVLINEEKCIHCGVCIKECPSRVLKAQGAHISQTLHEHEYNVILVPTSLLSDTKSYEDFKKICFAIKKLGFDEVLQYSDIEGFLYKKSLEDSHNQDGVSLTSFCPAINYLIKYNYPTLYDNILPYNYPVEVAAKKVRERLKDKDVGIYSLCECVGKMTLAKEPFGNEKSNIDYALSISHIFPKINKLKSDEKLEIEINKYGVKKNVENLFGNRSSAVVRAEGFNQIKGLLDLLEFEQLEHIELVALYACYQGCIGGHYLWSNPYEGYYNIDSMLDDCKGDILELKEEDYYKSRQLSKAKMESMKERMQRFAKVNEILESLPQYDCGACGFSNCRSLANNMYEGKTDISACRVMKR